MILTDKEKAILRAVKKYAVMKRVFRDYANKSIDIETIRALLRNNIIPIKASTKRICDNDDHCSQFDYLAHMIMNFVQTAIVWANRGGSKTYFMAYINWDKTIRYDGLESVMLGASKEQSLRAYKATRNFWNIGSYEDVVSPLAAEYVRGEVLRERTEYKNGSEMYILSASTKSARGPHPQLLNLDEIDEMDAQVLEDALSQPQEKNDIPSQTLISSTNHIALGNMDSQIEKALHNKDARIFKWCVWETLEACTDYECSTCPLSSYCPGKQMKTATGYYKIKDFIQKLMTLSMYTVEVEWFCNKIGSPDLVYKDEFDINIHVIDIAFNPNKPVYLSIDWGGTHPFALGVYQDYRNQRADEQIKLNAWVRIDEIYMGGTDNPHVIEEAKKRPWWNNIHYDGIVCDPSRHDLRLEWNTAGVNTVGADNNREIGISRVKGALKPVLGRPMIYISNRCRHFIGEILSYKQKNGIPIKKNDDAMDEFRYFVITKVNPVEEQSVEEPILTESEFAKSIEF